MKKIFLFLVLSIFLFSFVSAIDIEMKESYKLGETALVKISGNFIEGIEKDDVKFYRGNSKASSFTDYEVFEINEDYYIYFVVAFEKPADNYSINITGARYMVGPVESDEMISQEFEVLDLMADFYLSPGAGISSEDFNIEVQNLKEGKQNITVESESYEFKSGEIKTFVFPITKNETKFISFSSVNQTYSFPLKTVYYNYSEGENETDEETNSSEGIVVNETSEEESEVIVNETIEEGENSIWDEEVPDSEDVKVTDEDTGETKTCSELGGTVCFTEIKNCIGKSFEAGNVTCCVGECKYKNCSELGGKSCEPNQKCEGKVIDAEDKSCCIGTCVLDKNKDNKKLIGWLIIIALVLFLAWFFGKKYRGTINRRGLLGRR